MGRLLIEKQVLTRATWRNIPGDTILHSHRRENLKSYGHQLDSRIYSTFVKMAISHDSSGKETTVIGMVMLWGLRE
jgi:hypothetical protein